MDDLYIDSRRAVQKQTISQFIDSLKETSAILANAIHLPVNTLDAICLIGPYGAGKVIFLHDRNVC